MDGVRCDVVQFQLEWHSDLDETQKMIKRQETMLSADEDPSLARTVDEDLDVFSSQRQTRMHTPRDAKPCMRYVTMGDPLGSRTYGTVYKCIDIDLGRFMAVKILTNEPRASQNAWEISLHYGLTREVETISTISHVSNFIFVLYADN